MALRAARPSVATGELLPSCFTIGMQALTQTHRAATRRCLRCAALRHARALKHGRARDAARLLRERPPHLPRTSARTPRTLPRERKHTHSNANSNFDQHFAVQNAEPRRQAKIAEDMQFRSPSRAKPRPCARAGWQKLLFTSPFARSAKRKFLVFLSYFRARAENNNTRNGADNAPNEADNAIAGDVDE